MHIPPFDNQNKPIVDVDDPTVPLNYFNIVKLKKGDAFEYAVPRYETCVVPATGSVDVNIEGFKAEDLGGRVEDVWGGEPEGVYVPSSAKVEMVCTSDAAEIFVAGNRRTKSGVCWCLSCLQLARAAGQDFRPTNTTPTACRTKHATMRRIISASSPITARACRCSSARMANPATPITLSMGQRSASTMATIPARHYPAIRCTISRSLVG